MPGRVYNDGKVSDHYARPPQFAATRQGEAQVMDMICRRLLAALYPDYEYLSTQVLVGPPSPPMPSYREEGEALVGPRV